MQSIYFHNNSQNRDLDFMLSPRSVSSNSNRNNTSQLLRKAYRINYPKIQDITQGSYKQKQLKNHLNQNYLKDFAKRSKSKYAQYHFQPYVPRTLKRYDSNKLNDIGKLKKQLTRSKSASQIQQKSRFQILQHIQKTLQNQNNQQQSYQNLTETDKPKQFFRQNLSNRINRLQQYLYKIKKERQRQKIRVPAGCSGLQNNSVILGQRFQNKQKQKIEQQKNDEEHRRISNIKLLLQKLEDVKKQVLQLKKQRSNQDNQPYKKNYQNYSYHPNYHQNQQSRDNLNLTKPSGHEYPIAFSKFKSSMHKNQLQFNPNQQVQYKRNSQAKYISNQQPQYIPNMQPQYIPNMQTQIMQKNLVLPLENTFGFYPTVNMVGHPEQIRNAQKSKQINISNKKKVNFTFGKALQPNIPSSSKNISSILN